MNFFTMWLVVFAGLAFATAYFQYRTSQKATIAASASVEVTRNAERAYVQMSHHTPDKFDGGQAFSFKSGKPTVSLEVRNHGQTPATVTMFLILLHTRRKDEGWPKIPVATGKRIRVFLVPNAALQLAPEFDAEACKAIDIDKIKRGEDVLTLTGYVDYIDKFGAHHRAGYARVLDLQKSGNNLIFISEPGYNEVRPRKRGEGADWDDDA